MIMILLLVCILLNVLVGIAFKLFTRYKVNLFQAILFNYFSCIITAMICLKDASLLYTNCKASWFGIAVAMGAFFFLIFIIIGRSVESNGITITSVAQRLSMILPIVVAVVFFKEAMTVSKLLGILLAIVSIFLIIGFDTSHNQLRRGLIFAILTWIGSSIVDLLLYLVQQLEWAQGAGLRFTAALFTGAAIAAGALILYRMFAYNEKLEAKSILGGILLGIPNFFSIYLVLYLLQHGMQGTVLFPINNVGIILTSAIIGHFIFKESIDRRKLLGLATAAAAIILLSST